MKATAEKSSHTTSTAEHQKSSQPFFAKAGGGDFFTPVRNSSAPSVQSKLTVNKPGDKFEEEADKMADKVMRMPAPAPPEKEEKVQRATLPEDKVPKKEEEKLQRKGGDGTSAVASDTQSAIKSKTSAAQPLSSEARSYMEP